MKALGLQIAGVAAATLLAVACGDEPPRAAPAPAAPAPAAAAPAPEAAADAADAGTPAPPPYQYAYNPLGKRDPFRAVVEDAHQNGGPECSEPLCQFDLEQLALVAVVSGDANPIAMLEDPGRVGHIVRRSSRVGKHGGKVTQILRDCIVVTEFWTGPDGKANPNPIKKCIQSEANVVSPLDLINPQKRY